MRIALLRHGETAWNVTARFQGVTDIPLGARGIEQAQDAGRMLRGRGWSRIYSSPLLRARRTAEIIAEGAGLPAPAVHDGLIERSFGELEGQSVYLEDGTRRSIDHPSVEPRATVAARAQAAVNELAEAHPRDDLILVAHGTLIRFLLTELLGEPGPHVANLGFSMIERVGARFVVRVANGYPLS